MSWIYDTNHDNTARYSLSPRGEKLLFCFGINPSTASPEKLDNTLRSVKRIAKRHDYDAFMMFNVYPQRATNPNDMHAQCDEELPAQNLYHIKKYLREHPTERNILAAWGTLIHKRPYLKECLRDIYTLSQKYHCSWYCIGPCSEDGHPHHPLYLSNEEGLKPFTIEAYIDSLK